MHNLDIIPLRAASGGCIHADRVVTAAQRRAAPFWCLEYLFRANLTGGYACYLLLRSLRFALRICRRICRRYAYYLRIGNRKSTLEAKM